MNIILGKDSNNDAAFKLDIALVKGAVFIKEGSMGKAVDHYNTSRNANVKSRTADIPHIRHKGCNYYSPLNAVNFLDQIHSFTRPETALLMMKIATEL